MLEGGRDNYTAHTPSKYENISHKDIYKVSISCLENLTKLFYSFEKGCDLRLMIYGLTKGAQIFDLISLSVMFIFRVAF